MHLKIRAVCAKKNANFCKLASASVCGLVVLTIKKYRITT